MHTHTFYQLKSRKTTTSINITIQIEVEDWLRGGREESQAHKLVHTLKKKKASILYKRTHTPYIVQHQRIVALEKSNMGVVLQYTE